MLEVIHFPQDSKVCLSQCGTAATTTRSAQAALPSPDSINGPLHGLILILRRDYEEWVVWRDLNFNLSQNADFD